MEKRIEFNEYCKTTDLVGKSNSGNVAAIQGEGYLLKFSTNSGLNKLYYEKNRLRKPMIIIAVNFTIWILTWLRTRWNDGYLRICTIENTPLKSMHQRTSLNKYM